MEQAEKNYLDERFNRVFQEIDANARMDMQKQETLYMALDEIKQSIDRNYAEQRKTNGRVTKLEQETTVQRFLQRKPLLFILLMLLLALISDMLTNEQILGLILKGIAL